MNVIATALRRLWNHPATGLVIYTAAAVAGSGGLMKLTRQLIAEANTWDSRLSDVRAAVEAEEHRLQTLVAQRWAAEHAATDRAVSVTLPVVDEPAPALDPIGVPGGEPPSYADRVAARITSE